MSVSPVISPGSRPRLGDRWGSGIPRGSPLPELYTHLHSCIFLAQSHLQKSPSSCTNTFEDSGNHTCLRTHTHTHTLQLCAVSLRGSQVAEWRLLARRRLSHCRLQRQITIWDRCRCGPVPGASLHPLPNPLSAASFRVSQYPSHIRLLTFARGPLRGATALESQFLFWGSYTRRDK